MTIITDKIVFGGKSFAKINGKSVFIPYAIPGEQLEIEIVKSKNDWDEAKIIKILKPSPSRITPPCKYYEECGGCNMMHIESSMQKKLRMEMLYEVFLQNKIELGKDGNGGNIEIAEGNDFNYRCRFQLNNGGLCKRESNETIQIDECLCAEKAVNDYLKSTAFTERPKGRIHIFGSERIISEKKVIIEEQKEEFSNKTSQRIIGNKKKKLNLKSNNYFAGTVQNETNCVTLRLGDKDLSFDARGFFQSNLNVFEKVINLIIENLHSGETVLDMYSGCGSISVFLAKKFNKVLLVEHNRDALVYAEKNMSGINHVSYGLSGKNWVENCSNSEGKIDACVVDPPRLGMEKEVLNYLCKAKIKQIAYLSCNPATQARDCKKLLENGYIIKKTYLCDFYPNTSHIESLLILEQKSENGD
ncbi:MAG: RsmD family RNA methyltransferase [Spirochaetales bacterium]|nr:RsmD family RNA methyltransferase [Spirochaetales bacterium]